MRTPEQFLHYCADTDVLQHGCGRKKKKITFSQKRKLQHRQMHSRGCVRVSLGKVNDFLIDLHSICGRMEANADVKTFQQIIRIHPETIFALLT